MFYCDMRIPVGIWDDWEEMAKVTTLGRLMIRSGVGSKMLKDGRDRIYES